LAAEGVERGDSCGGGILRGGMRRELLSVSIVNVVIIVFLLCRALRGQHMDHSAGKGKAILNQIDDGERTAMVGARHISSGIVALTNGRCTADVLRDASIRYGKLLTG
jgi:hypothetical protein